MITKPRHGGAQEESMLIKKYADQWCRDNGYRITARVVQRGRKYGRNVSKKRQVTDSVYAAEKK